MNWSDYVVLGIILAFALIGLINGFVFSVFKIAAFFLSIYVSIKFYPAASGLLAQTPLYDSVKASILRTLTAKGQETMATAGGQASGAAAETVIGGLGLPGIFKESLLKKMPDPKELVDLGAIMNSISGELAKMIMSVLGLILLYILVRIALMIIGYLLKGITKLPVISQLDKLGGFALGIAEGVLTVYVLCAILVLFSSAPWFGQVSSAFDGSLLAGFFYENNLIVNFMFPSGKA